MIKKIYLKDKDGQEVAKIVAENDNEEEEMNLEGGEEIIGIYGHKDSCNAFRNLGFIVWKPIYNWFIISWNLFIKIFF